MKFDCAHSLNRKLFIIRLIVSYVMFQSAILFSSCDADDVLIPTPQLAEYSSFEDCPVDVTGNLNDYFMEASALVSVEDDYPADHFSMSISSIRSFGAQSILLIISGKYDSLSLGVRANVLRDNLKDTIRVAPLNLGEMATGVQLTLDGGISTSMTAIDYVLDETVSSNFFVLDSVDFVNNNPRSRGGMWFGRFDLKFSIEETSENRESVNYARSIGVQIPEKLHYKEASFSAPTRVNFLDFNCGR